MLMRTMMVLFALAVMTQVVTTILVLIAMRTFNDWYRTLVARTDYVEMQHSEMKLRIASLERRAAGKMEDT